LLCVFLGLDEKFVRKMRSNFSTDEFADDHAIALSAWWLRNGTESFRATYKKGKVPAAPALLLGHNAVAGLKASGGERRGSPAHAGHRVSRQTAYDLG